MQLMKQGDTNNKQPTCVKHKMEDLPFQLHSQLWQSLLFHVCVFDKKSNLTPNILRMCNVKFASAWSHSSLI